MSRACTICIHPKRGVIEADRLAGHSYRTLADRYDVAETSLKRHCAAHLDHTKRTASSANRAKAPTAPVADRVQGQHISPGELVATQEAFLAAFVELANESAACRVAHIDRGTVRYWEEHDSAFSPRYHEAQATVNDSIRGEIYRRGVLGYTREVATPKGSVVTVREYSDRLLEFIAKSRMRGEFGEKSQVDVTSNGQTVGQGITLDQLAALMQQLQRDVSQWEREHGYDHDDLDTH